MSGPSEQRGIVHRGDHEAGVRTEVEALRRELSPRGRRRAAGLDDSFERLGFGSLEMTELVLRVEQRFDVVLPPDLLVSAETPRDIVSALGRSRAGRDAAAISPPPPLTSTAGVPTSPAEGTTLLDVLDWHRARHPSREHLRLLHAGGPPDPVSYDALAVAAGSITTGLVERGVAPGESVASMLPTGSSYFETFLGVLGAGAVPVPIYPPSRRSQLADHLRRQVAILANAHAVELVTVAEARPFTRLLRAQVGTLRGVSVAEELPVGGSVSTVKARPEDVALLQYTSGSTGSPKGVVLTHANLLANIRAMSEAARVRTDDVFVSWLPLYHDMGLIGAWLGSMVEGVRLAVMSPLDFLTRPSRWLWAIHEHGGTISAGPNFAYSLCAARTPDAELEGLDLSGWRMAFNGAEPVRAETLERFSRRFEPYGFRADALMPVYGLAECSVGLTFPPPGREPVVDRVAGDRFRLEGRAAPVGPHSSDASAFVSCGRPLPGHDVRVVGVDGTPMSPRREGRIHFRGPSATRGYLRNPIATRELFVGDWLDTGDLGYLADGELYVTGRVKDLIVRAGRNLHPEELEEAVGGLEGVRRGCVVVFGSGGTGISGEEVVVVAETRATDPAERAALIERIVEASVDVLDAPADDVVLVTPGTVPKTSSGKIRRAEARELFEQEVLEVSTSRRRATMVQVGLAALAAQFRAAVRGVGDLIWSAYAAIVLVVVLPSALVALAVTPGLHRRRQVARIAVRVLARGVGMGVDVRHTDQLPTGTTVVVANHASWIDALVLTASLPARFTFVAGEILATRRLASFVLRRVGARYVDRTDREHGVDDTDRLVGVARSGESLVLFPEGGLDRRRGIRAFRLGAFVIAARAGVPVTPVVIAGTRAILEPRRKRVRRGSAVVSILPAVRPAGEDWAAAISLRNAARSVIAAHSPEPDLDR